MKMSEATREAIAIHQAAGRRFEAGGVAASSASRAAAGPWSCVHGVPTSLVPLSQDGPAVAGQGLHAVAFDFPGLGLADRPDDFDYSWSGLARWMGEAIDALDIDRCHLVVHDIGGPIGFEWAIRNPDRVLSMTALNTLLDVATFQAALADAAVRDPRDRRGVAGDAPAVAGASCSTSRESRTAPPRRGTRWRLTSTC